MGVDEKTTPQGDTSMTSLTVYDTDDTSRRSSTVSLPHIKLDYVTSTTLLRSDRARTSPSITPVQQLAERVVFRNVWVRCRLWRISSCIRNQTDIPQQFYLDLIELQRFAYPIPDGIGGYRISSISGSEKSLYPEAVRQKAWTLLVHLLSTSHVQEAIKALLTFPQPVILGFIRSTINENPPIPNHDVTPVCAVVAAIQRERPSFLYDILSLPELCCAVVRSTGPEYHSGLSLIIYGLTRVAQAFTFHDYSTLHSKHPVSSEHIIRDSAHLSTSRTGGQLSSWDLPPFADCVINYLISAQPGELHNTIRYYIVSSMHPYAQRYPTWTNTAWIFHHPQLRINALHPTHPFLYLAIHLAYRSHRAAALFIEGGVLRLLGSLWLYDFPDPLGTGPITLDKRPLRTELRVGCLLLLGALARHYPSTRGYADRLLNMETETVMKKVMVPMSVVSPRSEQTSHYASIYTLASSPWPDASNAIPPLTLFLMETCVANGVPIANTGNMFGNPWPSLISLLSRKDTNTYCQEVKDAVVRVLLSCASTPEEHWQPFIEALYIWSEETSCYGAFHYILHSFLQVSGDVSAIRKENVDALRRMYQGAKSRGSEVVNPIDRFIMLIYQASVNRYLSATLYDVGLAQLLHSAMQGRYDFLGDGSPTAQQRHIRAQMCAKVSHELDIAYQRAKNVDTKKRHSAKGDGIPRNHFALK